MPIYEVTESNLKRLQDTSFKAENIEERRHLQQLIKRNITTLAPDLMVLAEEFGDWDESRRRIDLLCLDSNADLVVVELKRTEDGGHSELQALRYAAMVSAMTFDQAVRAHEAYLRKEIPVGDGSADAAEETTEDAATDGTAAILAFLDWEEAAEDKFAQNVRIILASAEFSLELTTSVMWLNEHDVDIRCVRLRPSRLGEHLVVDIQQIIPLPESADYQVRIKEKARSGRKSKAARRAWDRERFVAEVRNNRGDDAAAVVDDLLDWAEAQADYIDWGKGAEGSFSPQLNGAVNRFGGFRVWTGGTVQNQFQQHTKKGPFADESLRTEWLERLNAIPAVDLSARALSAMPSFNLRHLVNPAAREAFKEVYGWVIRTIREYDPASPPDEHA